MQPFSETLNRHIIDIAKDIRWIATPDAPETYAELVARVGDSPNGVIPVSGAHCENTIYGNPYANLCFRAWHDWAHLDNGEDNNNE